MCSTEFQDDCGPVSSSVSFLLLNRSVCTSYPKPVPSLYVGNEEANKHSDGEELYSRRCM